ncbi:MAG: helix-turn-helix domain-containing protein [Marinifilaceae bacterium]
MRKKFRTLPNYFLIFILGTIAVHYIYYYLLYSNVFDESSNLAYTPVSILTIAPMVIYYYVETLLYGKIEFTRQDLKHLIPIVINFGLFFPFVSSSVHKAFWLYLANNIALSLFIIYPILIIKKIGTCYKIEGITLRVFEYNRKETSLIKLILGMMTLHFGILLVKNNLPLVVEGVENTLNIINLSYFLVLGYAISYVMISEPKSLKLAEEKIGLGGFKKYEKSKLTRTKAMDNVLLLNGIMENEKPYLDPEFDLVRLSELSNLPSHNISETLNGLIGQSFNDYTNNYRVEEFKKLASKEEYKNFTILALAFEAGFKSKSTFNAAFKKFTGKTPSEYIKQL